MIHFVQRLIETTMAIVIVGFTATVAVWTIYIIINHIITK